MANRASSRPYSHTPAASRAHRSSRLGLGSVHQFAAGSPSSRRIPASHSRLAFVGPSKAKEEKLKMAQGRVANYFEERDFGFIAPDDGSAHVFVHVSHLTNADLLQKDQAVSFDIVTDHRRNKPRADRVRVL